MNYRTFRACVNHNTKVLKLAIAEGRPIVSILGDLYTWTSKPGELHSSVIMRNAHDLIPAAYLGLLANVNNTGTDAFEVDKNNTIIHCELKTSEIRSRTIWKGSRDALYIGSLSTPKDKASVASFLSAKYAFSKNTNRTTKYMKTILMVCDTDGPDGYFDAYEMSGSPLIKFLNKKSNRILIKFSAFMNQGTKAKTTVPLEGYHNWRNRIAQTAPLKVYKQPG